MQHLDNLVGLSQPADGRWGRAAEATEVKNHADGCAAELLRNAIKAYSPRAGLEPWRRVRRLDRARNHVELLDWHAITKPTFEITLTLVTPYQVTVTSFEYLSNSRRRSKHGFRRCRRQRLSHNCL